MKIKDFEAIILNYLDRPDQITWVLTSREPFLGDFRETCDIAGFADGRSGHESKNVDST